MPEPLSRYRYYILTVALSLGVVIGVIYLLDRPQPHVVTITTPTAGSSPTAGLIEVQVSGAVARPGVYQLASGSRLSAVLELAGGALPEAELGALNLARRLADGESISVPLRASIPNETLGPTKASVPSKSITIDPLRTTVININTATAEELDQLPHIGPTLAKRIIDYREANGPFKTIEEIKEVKGIGDSIFNEIQNLITVE